MQETVIRYSEAFKLKVVTELENGKLTSIEHARRKYGVKGNLTVTRWLKKYGRGDLLPRKVRIEMPDEQDQIRKLKEENHKLKLALADAKMDEVLSRALFEITCENFGVTDIESYKKKLDTKLSAELERSRKKQKGQ